MGGITTHGTMTENEMKETRHFGECGPVKVEMI